MSHPKHIAPQLLPALGLLYSLSNVHWNYIFSIRKTGPKSAQIKEDAYFYGTYFCPFSNLSVVVLEAVSAILNIISKEGGSVMQKLIQCWKNKLYKTHLYQHTDRQTCLSIHPGTLTYDLSISILCTREIIVLLIYI